MTRAQQIETALCIVLGLATIASGELGFLPDRFLTWIYGGILLSCGLARSMEHKRYRRSG